MSNESNSSDRLGTLVAVLIAVVSVVGALVAWRVAVASSAAGDEDTAGLLAAVDRENAITEAYTTLYGHLTAYSRAKRNDILANALGGVESTTTDENLKKQLEQQRDGLFYAANTARAFVPQQYLDRDQNFDQERDVGETIADRATRRNTYPEPHFQSADAHRGKAEQLLWMLLVLGIAFVLLTLADALASRLRYVMLLAAVLVLLAATFGALFIEMKDALNWII